MKFLVIGLGSMGKRRIRNLLALGQTNIAGFDIRLDRTEEANSKYSIDVYNDFEKCVDDFKPDAFLISTPPDLHMKYAFFAYKNGIHCFIEASVIDADKILELSGLVDGKPIVMAPSCSMRYFSGPKKIKELVNDGVVGKPLNFNYQTGQYLPDWHPWESINDFYVSNPVTGGCREIVPFELTWLNDVFGNPEPAACLKSKVSDIEADIDDIYHCLLMYPDGLIGNLTVEVVSRPKATRHFRLIGSKGELVFCGDDNSVKYINVDMDDWQTIAFEKGTIESKAINPEEPYIREVSDYINAIENCVGGKESMFPNKLADDYEVLQVLYKLEKLSAT